ncbi:hypothetical protein AB1K54_04815 [Microbacterium sp. BWT-B31]|uniref:hypothetical protein n=1 Tax=Microbacterium sp. BWT-B31 TaxID=3232072 RepID=UPI0035296C51
MASRNPRTTLFRVAVVAIAATGALALASCQPEPEPDPIRSASPTTAPPPPATPAATPAATDEPVAGFVLPTECEQIYSASMLSSLQAENPPLNDPGVTMLSTQNVDALEILESGIPTLRCTWGQPGGIGLATNVTAVSADQTAALESGFRNAAFGCAAELGATVCRIEQRSISLDDVEVVQTETQVLREGVWVSTRTINFAPDGYTEDVVATMWG